MDGYYGLAHRDNRLASDRHLVESYAARLKCSLLFHARLILADHMIVNSPNLPLALERFPDLSKLFVPDLISIAHMERNKDMTHKTLDELFEFYRGGNALHPRFDARHFPVNGASFFASIGASAGHSYPDSTLRDPNFTRDCDILARSEHFKAALGADYYAFLTAYNLLREDVSVVGIIHFDPEHKWKGDETIFDYIQRTSKFRQYSVPEIERHFSLRTTPAFRALLMRVEIALLSCQAILPKELLQHQGLLLSPTAAGPLELSAEEKDEVELDVSSLSVEALATLPVGVIRELRESDEGQAFLHHVDVSDMRQTKDLVKSYLERINLEVNRYCFAASVAPKRRARLRFSKGALGGRGHLLTPWVATLIQFLGWLNAAFLILDPISKYALAKLPIQDDVASETPKADVVVARETHARLTQFLS